MQRKTKMALTMTFILGLMVVSSYFGVTTTEAISPPWEDPGNGGTPYGKAPIRSLPFVDLDDLIFVENIVCCFQNIFGNN